MLSQELGQALGTGRELALGTGRDTALETGRDLALGTGPFPPKALQDSLQDSLQHRLWQERGLSPKPRGCSGVT